MTTTILLIDDHPLFRKGVAQLVSDDAELALVGEAGDGAEGIALAHRLQPDVVLIDLNMKPMGGIHVLRALKAAGLRSRCMVLTVSDSERDVVEAMRAGADGYLLKDLEPEQLCPRIKQAARGAVVLEHDVAALLTHALSAPAPTVAADFTEREHEALELLADGCSNKDIARRLGISEATVKVHVKNLLRKLNMKSRLEAAVWYLHHSPERPRTEGD